MTSTLVALAAHRLAGARVPPFEDVPLPDSAWQGLAGAAAAHGLRGLLADAVDHGTFTSTVEQRTESASAHIGAMTGCLALESALLDALDVLTTRGVDALVVHGIAAAHLDYADPAWRPFGDVDLLVRASDIAAARTSLGVAGFHATGPSQPNRLVDDTGRHVDLHTHAVPSRWARHVSEFDVWQQPAELTLAGRSVLVLADEPRLVATCLKARATADHRLIAARDVVQQVLGRAEPEGVLDIARRWQATAGVAAAIDDAWDRFAMADVVALSVWAARNHQQAQPLRAGPRRNAFGRRWLVRR